MKINYSVMMILALPLWLSSCAASSTGTNVGYNYEQEKADIKNHQYKSAENLFYYYDQFGRQVEVPADDKGKDD